MLNFLVNSSVAILILLIFLAFIYFSIHHDKELKNYNNDPFDGYY
jgi:hypothetical protein